MPNNDERIFPNEFREAAATDPVQAVKILDRAIGELRLLTPDTLIVVTAMQTVNVAVGQLIGLHQMAAHDAANNGAGEGDAATASTATIGRDGASATRRR